MPILSSIDLRIERIELQNFRGVKNGVIEFNCLKNPLEKETCSDILGIYGQNGSGKTTLLEALQIAQLAMAGRSIPFARYGNIISKDAESARMTISFQATNSDGSNFHLEYSFSLVVWEFALNTKDQEKSSEGSKKSASAFKPWSAAAIAGAAAASGLLLPVTALGAGAIAAGVSANVIGLLSSQKKQSSLKEFEGSSEYLTTGKHLGIIDEVLSLSGEFNGTSIRYAPIFDTRSTDTVFLPKAKQKVFFPNKTASVLKVLEDYKAQCRLFSRSFIFCDGLSALLLEQESISEYAKLILNLKGFSNYKMFILDPKTIAGENLIPLFTANQTIYIRKSDSSTNLDEYELLTLRTAIKGLNVILQHIIPGLSIEAVKQVDVDINDQKATVNKNGTNVTVYSVRNNIRIPLAEESAGIIRLISFMGMFSFAFVNKDVTVAIDEIDAGVYEHLLGELLLIFEEYGSGQLIFTCHNLRPMEVLNKKYIYFTTTNPDNRYLKPKSNRNENNLRDVYLKEIVVGGQEEELYSTAKHGKIASALQKAGEIIGQD